MSTAGLSAVLVLFPLLGWAEKGGGLEFRADPRVELFASLHALTSSDGETEGFRWNESPYSSLLRRRVEPLRAHAAVGLYRRAYENAARRGWGYMGVLNSVLPCLDDSLRLSSGPECAAGALAREAADFARKAGLGSFPEARRALAAYEAQLRDAAPRLDPLGLFAAFTGLKTSVAQRISPSPLLLPGQVWNRLEEASLGRKPSILTVVAPKAAAADLRFDLTPLAWDVWHEQGHAQLDEELEAYPERLERLRPLLELLAPLCYQSWRQCLREHLAQGIAHAAGRWAREKGKLSLAEPPFKSALPHLRLVVERLEEFDGGRSRYKTIREFYPRLLDVFDELEAPGDPVSDLRARGRRLKDEGLKLFQEGRFQEALEDFAAAAAADTEDSEAHLNRGVVLVELGRLEEALASLDAAVTAAEAAAERFDPLLADALSSRAWLLRRLGRGPAARRDCERILKEAPEDWPRLEEIRGLLRSLPR